MSADTRKLVTNENLSAFAERLAEKVPLKSDLPTKVSDLANDRGFTDNAGTITSVTINGVTTSSGGVNLGYLVAAENGKGLSSNDYTTAEKNKLAGIDSGAEANTIETVKVNGVSLTPDGNKAVDVTVPTTVAELSDASNYALASDLEDYAQVSDLEDTEEVLTAAVTDLNSRLEDAEDAIGEMSSSLETLQQNVRDFPTNVSDFDNDAGYINTEIDPVFSASPAAQISTTDMAYWDGKQDPLTFDSVPTQNSTNPVTSGGLYTVITQNEYTAATALNDLNDRVSGLEEIEVPEVDEYPTENSNNAVSSGGVYEVITENELAIAASLSDLNSKIEDITVPENISDLYDDVGLATSSDLSNYVLKSDYEDDEEVIATAVNDLNTRVLDIEDGLDSIEDSISNIPEAPIEIIDVGTISFNNNIATLPSGTYNSAIAAYNSGKIIILKGSNSFVDSYYTLDLFGDGNNFYFINSYNNQKTILMSNDTLWIFGQIVPSESDPVFSASPAAGITAADITNWNGKTSNTGTLTGVSFNGTSATVTNGVAAITASIPTESTVSGWGFTKNAGTVVGSGLTADKLVLGNGTTNIKTSTYGVSTSAPASGSDNTTIPTSAAVFSAIDTALTSVLTYRGTIGSSGATVSALPASHAVGDVYVVSVAGTYAGKACEVGDYIICHTAGSSASDAHWNVVNGENQVDNKSASLAAAGSSATIATVDGTNLTITTPSGWTGVDKTGTITGINMNGASKGTSGVVDLGTVITSETALSKGTATGSGNAVTDISVSGHQITLTKGKTFLESFTETDPVFSASPAAGITASDITNWNGKTSNTGTLTGVSFNGASATVTNGVAAITATIPAEVTESIVSGWGFTKNTGTLTTETDPVFSASAAAGITSADITNWNGKTSNTGTITGITMNGASKGTSGVVNLGTVITSETQLSKGTTTGAGNAVTDISVSNHQITLTKGATFLTEHQSIKTINNQTITGTGNVNISGLPAVTSSDNGKILQVVNGAWTLVSPISIYSGSESPSNSIGNNGDIYIQS